MTFSEETREQIKTLLNGYYWKIASNPEISNEEILNMLQDDIDYIDQESALATVNNVLNKKAP